MPNIVEPIHVAVINGNPLRFFQSPVGATDPDWTWEFDDYWQRGGVGPEPNRPDFPWVSLEDWALCLGLQLNERRSLLRKFAPPASVVLIEDGTVRRGLPTRHEVPCTRTIATRDGLVVIASNVIIGELQYRSDDPRAHGPLYDSYSAALRAAVDVVTAGFSCNQLWSWIGGAQEREVPDFLALRQHLDRAA